MDKTIATVAVEIYQAYKALYFSKRKDGERFGAYRRKQKPRKAFIVFRNAKNNPEYDCKNSYSGFYFCAIIFI